MKKQTNHNKKLFACDRGFLILCSSPTQYLFALCNTRGEWLLVILCYMLISIQFLISKSSVFLCKQDQMSVSMLLFVILAYSFFRLAPVLTLCFVFVHSGFETIFTRSIAGQIMNILKLSRTQFGS